MVACSLQANQHLLDVYPCLLGPAASLSASLFRPAAIRHAERRQDLSGVYLILFINNQPTVSAVSRACLLTATPAEFEVENTKIPRSFLSTVTLPPWKLLRAQAWSFCGSYSRTKASSFIRNFHARCLQKKGGCGVRKIATNFLPPEPYNSCVKHVSITRWG